MLAWEGNSLGLYKMADSSATKSELCTESDIGETENEEHREDKKEHEAAKETQVGCFNYDKNFSIKKSDNLKLMLCDDVHCLWAFLLRPLTFLLCNHLLFLSLLALSGEKEDTSSCRTG